MGSGGPAWETDSRAIRWIGADPGTTVDTSRWPATVPAAGQLLCEGLELPPGLTVLVGEIGSGKSILKVNQPGFYLMDEPDALLSFTACLALAAVLYDLAQAGSQAIVATHSPILAAVPGANILELGDWGIRPARWEDLNLVGSWRAFLAEPAAYFRHLLSD
jgi:predicted ATPase